MLRRARYLLRLLLLAQALIGVLSLSALNRQITDMTADRLEVAARQIGGRIENGCAWESRWASTSGWPGICTTASRRPRTWAARPSIYWMAASWPPKNAPFLACSTARLGAPATGVLPKGMTRRAGGWRCACPAA